ncbi:hypothetical protein ACXR0O_19090 [Verrucomicrobiota bacterium sgz303538]
MSRKPDPISTVRKTVVVFDICSSTAILEDLLRTEHQRRWRNLLIGVKKTLVEAAQHIPFEIYKFVGDGWILLFDEGSVSSTDLMRFMKLLSATYHHLFHNGICAVLGPTDLTIGLTFGIDAGTLVKIVMNGNAEYIGRALNIAARLQGAVRECDGNPADTLLISKNAYTRLKFGKTKASKGTLVECHLRNVAGGERYQVRKLKILK